MHTTTLLTTWHRATWCKICLWRIVSQLSTKLNIVQWTGFKVQLIFCQHLTTARRQQLWVLVRHITNIVDDGTGRSLNTADCEQAWWCTATAIGWADFNEMRVSCGPMRHHWRRSVLHVCMFSCCHLGIYRGRWHNAGRQHSWAALCNVSTTMRRSRRFNVSLEIAVAGRASKVLLITEIKQQAT